VTRLELQLAEEARRHEEERARWREDRERLKMAAERIRLMERERRKCEERVKGLLKVVEGGGGKPGVIEVRGTVLTEVEGEVGFGQMVMEGHKKQIEEMAGQLAREQEVRMEVWRGLREAGVAVKKAELLEVANVREVMIRLKQAMISNKVLHREYEQEESMMFESKDLLSLTQSTIL